MKIPFAGVENKTLRIWLRISLIPYVIIFLAAIYGFIVGIDFFSVNVGVDGALLGILFAVVAMTIIPVLPVAVVFQIISFTNLKMKENGIEKKTRKRTGFIIFGIFAAIAIAILCHEFRLNIEEYFDGVRAKRYYRRAECVVEYDLGYHYDDGPFNIQGYRHNLLTIDYDEKIVCIMKHDYMDRLWVYKLKPTSEDAVQTYSDVFFKGEIRDIDSPGDRLILFESHDYDDVRAVFLKMEDGSVWYADNNTDGERVYFNKSYLWYDQ